jgi:hypothetical protein
MTELDKLISENKQRFTIDKEVLEQRINNRLISYDNILPPVNIDNTLYKRVRKHYSTLQALLIDSAAKLNSDFTLDATSSKFSSRGFTVTYIKSKELQKADLVKLKREEKNLYQAELDLAKKVWIKELTVNQAKEAEVLAKQQAVDNTKALQAELSKLLSVK